VGGGGGGGGREGGATVYPSATTDAEGRSLLRLLGFPFKEN
jgi:hypothetical protein